MECQVQQKWRFLRVQAVCVFGSWLSDSVNMFTIFFIVAKQLCERSANRFWERSENHFSKCSENRFSKRSDNHSENLSKITFIHQSYTHASMPHVQQIGEMAQRSNRPTEPSSQSFCKVKHTLKKFTIRIHLLSCRIASFPDLMCRVSSPYHKLPPDHKPVPGP